MEISRVDEGGIIVYLNGVRAKSIYTRSLRLRIIAMDDGGIARRITRRCKELESNFASNVDITTTLSSPLWLRSNIPFCQELVICGFVEPT